MTMRLAGIGVPDVPAAWEAIGCTVVDGAVPFANGALLLGSEGIFVAETDGPVPTSPELSTGSHALVAAVEHPSGAFELDHVVVLTNSLERTSATVHEIFGLERRRTREAGPVRQAFHRFDDPPGVGSRGCIIEVVESDRVEETTIMGVVLNVTDLFDLADRLGPAVMSLPKPAVQAGRYISTVRRDVGLATAVALMTP
jgi:hypothetical protein